MLKVIPLILVLAALASPIEAQTPSQTYVVCVTTSDAPARQACNGNICVFEGYDALGAARAFANSLLVSGWVHDDGGPFPRINREHHYPAHSIVKTTVVQLAEGQDPQTACSAVTVSDSTPLR